jgi:hypothetical protein
VFHVIFVKHSTSEAVDMAKRCENMLGPLQRQVLEQPLYVSCDDGRTRVTLDIIASNRLTKHIKWRKEGRPIDTNLLSLPLIAKQPHSPNHHSSLPLCLMRLQCSTIRSCERE